MIFKMKPLEVVVHMLFGFVLNLFQFYLLVSVVQELLAVFPIMLECCLCDVHVDNEGFILLKFLLNHLLFRELLL